MGPGMKDEHSIRAGSLRSDFRLWPFKFSLANHLSIAFLEKDNLKAKPNFGFFLPPIFKLIWGLMNSRKGIIRNTTTTTKSTEPTSTASSASISPHIVTSVKCGHKTRD